MNGSVKKYLLGIGAVIFIGGVAMGIFSGYFRGSALYKPDGKYRIAMAGRSVMDQWFKYWNWPFFLHDYAVYREWPIPHTRYIKDRYYLEYIPIDSPHVKSDGKEYGARMFESIQNQVDEKKYDALFFKFCFVDFSDKNLNDADTESRQFKEMTSLVEKVYVFATEKNLKLILGNALPTETPGRYAQQLRLDFNNWVKQYVAAHPDIIPVDLFHPLTDDRGVMRAELARSPDDSHVNRKGYQLLDKELFDQLRKAAR